ncbi:hypothetical protein B0H14DRAFT_2674223 [Mycena olivaceomarginata]|nr:hypothetical protein B0H14DRAFT_2674223 [Mycena olivaceomarginata]
MNSLKRLVPLLLVYVGGILSTCPRNSRVPASRVHFLAPIRLEFGKTCARLTSGTRRAFQAFIDFFRPSTPFLGSLLLTRRPTVLPGHRESAHIESRQWRGTSQTQPFCILLLVVKASISELLGISIDAFSARFSNIFTSAFHQWLSIHLGMQYTRMVRISQHPVLARCALRTPFLYCKLPSAI